MYSYAVIGLMILGTQLAFGATHYDCRSYVHERRRDRRKSRGTSAELSS